MKQHKLCVLMTTICIFIFNLNTVHTQTIALKVNGTALLHGFGALAEMRVTNKLGIVAEFQEVHFNHHTQSALDIFPSEPDIYSQSKGKRISLIGRYYPSNAQKSGFFFEFGCYLGKYQTFIQVGKRNGFSSLGTDSEVVADQKDVAAYGIRTGLGWSKTENHFNYEISSGFSMNSNHLDSRAYKLSNDFNFYLRAAIGGAFNLRKRNN